MKCLNLGCGARLHPAWTNVDYVASAPSVMTHDLRRGVPFPDDEFDVVYHSHVLEHFSKTQGRQFLRECFRVLKRGGTLRVAVPDLERIAEMYLRTLEQAAAGDERARHDYDWMMLELYDQTVRETTGGEMAAYMRREGLPNEDFVVGRIGAEARQVIDAGKRARPERAAAGAATPIGSVLGRLRRFLGDRAARREALVRRLLGEEYELLKLGRFRRGGEIHLWMYDRYSLALALGEAGFRGARAVGPTESRVPSWADYHLDTDRDGTTYKPDSLFMEAFK